MAVSMTFFNCVLKGLQRSPRLVLDAGAMHHPSVLTVANVSVLVQPDKCIGLPTLAALEQGIPVVAAAPFFGSTASPSRALVELLRDTP